MMNIILGATESAKHYVDRLLSWARQTREPQRDLQRRMRLRLMRGGVVESDHELDLDAWVQAVGGPKKGHLIGFGPRVDAHSILGSSSTAPRSWESRYCAASSQADVHVDKLARQLEEE